MNRKVLYGYQIQNGEIAVHPAEADVVGRVFHLYMAELSYQQTADILNDERIPFSQDAPLWNKHKIKRLLENHRYTGKDGYPVLVDAADFQKVQERIREKSAGYTARAERPVLKLYLLCARCNHRLTYLAGPNLRKDTLYLKCADCGASITITDAALTKEIARQLAEHDIPAASTYAPNQEVIRLTNAVNRGLERPDQPEELVSLILQGIAARYDCCTAGLNIETNNRPAVVDWNHFGQAVSHITLTTKNAVRVYFKEE